MKKKNNDDESIKIKKTKIVEKKNSTIEPSKDLEELLDGDESIIVVKRAKRVKSGLKTTLKSFCSSIMPHKCHQSNGKMTLHGVYVSKPTELDKEGYIVFNMVIDKIEIDSIKNTISLWWLDIQKEEPDIIIENALKFTL